MPLPKYKDIVELLKKGATLEAQEKIMELREGALEIQEENMSLRGRVNELEEIVRVRGQLHYEAPCYWLEDAEAKDGPYCQNCYDSGEKLIRLQDCHNGVWRCLACEKTVTDSSHRSRSGKW